MRWFVVAMLGVVAACNQTRTVTAQSAAMTPTIVDGETVTVEFGRTVTRGDVILFRPPRAPDREWIMRVIALAGDTVEIQCHDIKLNEEQIPSTLVKRNDHYLDRDEGGQGVLRKAKRWREEIDGRPYYVHDRVVELDPCITTFTMWVPDDSVMVLGDNRAIANDSRAWGWLPIDHIIGRVK